MEKLVRSHETKVGITREPQKGQENGEFLSAVLIVGCDRKDRDHKFLYGDSPIAVRRSAKAPGVIVNDRATRGDHATYVLDQEQERHSLALLFF